MIGYYVDHHGSGHLQHAMAVAAALDEAVTGLSSLRRPEDWEGDWVTLDRDDEGGRPVDPTASGRLHWVPLGDLGLRRRSMLVSNWLAATRPRLVVVDVSVEIAVLVRLHGVPVVEVVRPGVRTDPAHRLGLDLADAIVGFWPPPATPDMLPGLPDDVRRRVCPVGALALLPVAKPRLRKPGPPRVVVVTGGGPDALDGALEEARRTTPDWEWTVLGPGLGSLPVEPRTDLEHADVVVTHAGQEELTEVAAARRPAVVVPQAGPYDEQATTAAALSRGGWPVLVEDCFPRTGWQARLEAAGALDGACWARWCDGDAARRFADVLAGTAEAGRVAS